MEEEFEILSFDSEEFYADDEAEWFYQTPLTMFQKKIWLHCVIRAELNAYLPSLTSPLGSNLNYLEGIFFGKYETLSWDVVERNQLDEAPWDAMLLSMMEASWNSFKPPGNLRPFGYSMQLMPDTQYMIDAISFFEKDMKYIQNNSTFWM